jgi:hypothetical protein
MSDEAPNQITPRQLAVLHIAQTMRQLTQQVEDYEADFDMAQLFHSQLRVLVHQTIEELRRAAEYLRTTDMADGG